MNEPARRETSRLLLAALALLSSLWTASCVERHDVSAREVQAGDCSACHGDPNRAGTTLERAAPPNDVLGASSSAYPGVGAHASHVFASATHGAVACSECHIVPERTDSPGHADDPAPAEVVFGSLASAQGNLPSYNPIARRCDNSYCHGQAAAVWTEPRPSSEACGSCHGLPPPPPHPQSDRCGSCHSATMDEQGNFRAPELHVNGTVEFLAGSCSACHGAGDNPAPPPDLEGNVSVAALGVGAHAVHLQGGEISRPVACSECHRIPARVEDPMHADGLPAEVEISGPGATNERLPTWDRTNATCANTWCHSPDATGPAQLPRWTEEQQLSCSSCHGMPPAPPHPQLPDCSSCHAEVVAADDLTIIDRNRHVDGVMDLTLNESCTACHGSVNSAPPADLLGRTSTSERSVGAHQIHLSGTLRARAVPCGECHQVPARIMTAGHIDSLPPAEIIFSGAAAAFGAIPRYENGVCENSPCHGGWFQNDNPSGGTHTTPEWTRLDGTQTACGGCHGLPPPRPHPYFSEDCGRCHKNITNDGRQFIRPDLHVDGVVTFELP